MTAKTFFIRTLRFLILTILYFPIWIIGSMAIGDLIPKTPSEPGLVSEELGMLILGTVNTLLIIAMILSSRLHGWRLALFLAFAYYGSFTLITQIETWYFLSNLTVSAELLPRLFIMGLTVPLIYIPLAILICKKWKKSDDTQVKQESKISTKQMLIKLSVISVIYVILYWLAGYFIAWQNPELRAFYGNPGEIIPFFQHTINTIGNTPDLFILQLVRGILFAIIVMPVIFYSKVKPWKTALIVGFLLAVPHLGHIMPNPLMPVASVRHSHMLETATSTFVFGLIIVWFLHRKHSSIKDLFSKS